MILDVRSGWPGKFPPQTFGSNVIEVGGAMAMAIGAAVAAWSYMGRKVAEVDREMAELVL